MTIRAVLAACCLILGLSSPLLAQRSDRATISGVVTDAQGSAVPGATVTVHNQDTGVDTVLTTNDAGAYNSPPLVLGRYVVSVDLEGFKKAVSSEILLQGGDAFRQDVRCRSARSRKPSKSSPLRAWQMVAAFGQPITTRRA